MTHVGAYFVMPTIVAKSIVVEIYWFSNIRATKPQADSDVSKLLGIVYHYP